MQTTRPRIMEGFTNGSGCHLKKYSIKKKDLDCELFYLNQNALQRLTLYLLSSYMIIFIKVKTITPC